ncbi:MAG TPA: SCO family protein [Lacunisphaera sp.]|jgi:protein SCO1/2|nr:SCO family protein [Lacunisphaera sp.]
MKIVTTTICFLALNTGCLCHAYADVGASLDDARGRRQAAPLQGDSAKPEPHACCVPKAAAKPDACCAAPPAGASAATFSKESIYQLDGGFTDDQGRPFTLGQLRGRPVVLDLFFASCGYACPLTVTDMLAIQGRLPAALRGQATFVLVSFDPERDTPAALAKYREQRGLDGQWVLLHGDDESVRELAALVGVKYRKEADGSFSHSNLLTILNAAGEIVHQRVGLQGGLDEAAAALAQVTSPAP